MRSPMFKRRPMMGWVLAVWLASPAVQALDLVQTWEQARQHDPQMQVVAATRASVQAFELQAKALWRPVVVGAATVGAMSADTRMQGAQFSAPGFSQSNGVSFATSANAATSTRWSLQAKQALYSPERTAQQAQLRQAATVAELRSDLAHQQFMLLTAQRYFNVLLAERQQQVLKNQHVAVSRSLAEVKDRFELGDLPVTDTHEAMARAEGLQAQLWVAENELQMARKVLAESARIDPKLLQPLNLRAQAAWTSLPDWADVQTRVVQGNVGLLLQKARWDVARQELKKHALMGTATLDLVAAAGRDRLSGEGDYGPATNTQSHQMLGLSLQIPLYSGGYRSGKLQEAVSAADQASAEFDLSLQQTQQQAHAVWLTLRTGPARLSAVQAALQASMARLDATRLGRQVGDRTTLELLQAENDAAQAELAWLRAHTELLLSRLQLDALTGDLSVQSLQSLNAHWRP